MSHQPVRVLLVDDSAVALTVLQQMLASSPNVRVVGTARNGKEALQQIPLLDPDVICTDLQMPVMGGLELTRQVMSLHPRPILVISSFVKTEDVQTTFHLFAAGALDIFPKPQNGLTSDSQQLREELVRKIRILAGVHVFRRPSVPSSIASDAEQIAQVTGDSSLAPRLAVIGASTGGPKAVLKVLSQLPPEFPIPVVCVQHISNGFLDGLIDWLGRESQLRIRIAKHGEVPLPGRVYFAPEQAHLAFSAGGQIQLTTSPPVEGHRPSITVTMRSAAGIYGRHSIGILLTGMGRDGADGLLAIARAGGLTLAQDEASSVVYGMPREAAQLGAARVILPLDHIGTALAAAVKKG